jgi:hypothetical protein
MASNSSEPFLLHLCFLTTRARVQRWIAGGMSQLEAAKKLAKRENAAEYVERNRSALVALEEWMLNPEYRARSEAIQREPDEAKQKAAARELKRETFVAVDMLAVIRAIRARHCQMKAEGMVLPDI